MNDTRASNRVRWGSPPAARMQVRFRLGDEHLRGAGKINERHRDGEASQRQHRGGEARECQNPGRPLPACLPWATAPDRDLVI